MHNPVMEGCSPSGWRALPVQDKAEAKLAALEARAEEAARARTAADAQWLAAQRERELRRAQADAEREKEVASWAVLSLLFLFLLLFWGVGLQCHYHGQPDHSWSQQRAVSLTGSSLACNSKSGCIFCMMTAEQVGAGIISRVDIEAVLRVCCCRLRRRRRRGTRARWTRRGRRPRRSGAGARRPTRSARATLRPPCLPGPGC